MSFARSGVLVGAIAAGTLLLSACGSDNNTVASSSSTSTSAASSSAASSPASSADSNSASGSTATSASPVAVECAGKETLKSSGSSAQANAMTRFIAAFEAACNGYSLDYTSNGSGAGVSEFIGGQTDFAGSDSPLNADKGEVDKAKERCASDAWNLPVVFGPIAVTYNVAGVTELNLDGPTVAKIFNGAITSWDDAAIAALNPGVTLPAEDINVIFRSDESGTTDNFQKYLDEASDGAWGKGAGKAFAGGVGEGAKGNEGTSAAVKSTDGAIGYSEWSFAKSADLTMASIITSAGPEAVAISTESVGKTIASATIKGTGNDLVIDTSTFYMPTATGAYPIVLPTYEIVCSDYADDDTAAAVKAFLTVTITTGQEGLSDNGYIPIPADFQTKLSAAIAAIA